MSNKFRFWGVRSSILPEFSFEKCEVCKLVFLLQMI